MGENPASVVDSRLRIRVIDALVLPTLTTGNTNAPSIMIAGKGAAMIREEAAVTWGRSGSIQAERSQQSQNNAVAAGPGGVAGTVTGNATASSRYYYGRGYYPYYRRGWR